jgi:ubiquinone/menaquinone biosynthesis C-methylase UbiE
MNPLSRFFVNAASARRSARTLGSLETGFRVAPSARILELGAGGGALSALLQERYRPVRLVVTDFDPHQVEVSRARLRQRLDPVPRSIELCRVDAKALPFADGSFEYVFAILMLHHVEAHHSEYRRRPLALREIRRVLAPGGSLIYSDFSHTADLDRTLTELGFTRAFERRRWPRRVLAVFRVPS